MASMLHFVVTFSDDASDSPMAHALRSLGVDHRILAERVRMQYRQRLTLLLFGLPRLLAFAFRTARRSLLLSQPRPDAVVVFTHLEALVFALYVTVLRAPTRIYLCGFIFTARRSRWLDRLRRLYFRVLFRHIDGVICHSQLEVERYRRLIPLAVDKYVYVPYGLHIDGHEVEAPWVAPGEGPALSAGRSGRDYPLLTRVFAASGRPLRVVCDSAQALAGCVEAPNITVLRQCYNEQYVSELRKAGLVVVPLRVDDISAGQMVVLQAMAYRKPIVVTDIPTLADYLGNPPAALLVRPGSAADLHEAVECLISDPSLARDLAERAYEHFESRHSMAAFVSNVVSAVNR